MPTQTTPSDAKRRGITKTAITLLISLWYHISVILPRYEKCCPLPSHIVIVTDISRGHFVFKYMTVSVCGNLVHRPTCIGVSPTKIFLTRQRWYVCIVVLIIFYSSSLKEPRGFKISGTLLRGVSHNRSVALGR